MAQISLKQLEAFVQVAKQGSFKRAAIALNTTQPNVSARISNLELQLNQTIMERDPGSVHLTAVGAELLVKSQKVLSAVEELIILAETPNLFQGVMRLGVTETIAHSWLSDFLNKFNHAFNNVTVDLTVDLSERLSAGLKNGSLDIAFQSGPFESKVAYSTDLGEVPLIWVASPSLANSEIKWTAEAISQYVILSHSKNTKPFQQLEKHFVKSGQRVRLVPSTSLAACLQMTLQGIGIACLPEAIVKNALETGELIRLDYQWTPDALKFEARINDAKTPHYVKEALKLAHSISK